MEAAEFEAAGLYDPDAPDAADRLALLEHLKTGGVTLEQMVAADAVGSLHAAATDGRLRPGRPMTAAEVADAAGISLELFHRVALAAGVVIPDDDYRESDIETFALFEGGAGVFGEEATLQFTRAVGSSMARVADAALSLFLVNVEAPMRKQGTVGASLAEASEDAAASLEVIPPLMGGFFRLHMQTAIMRQRVANRSTSEPALFRLAVGFVDLVGFTPYTQDVGPR